MARFIYLAGRTEARQRWHCQRGRGQGWNYCFGDSPQQPQTINAATSTGWENAFYLLICACLHWGARVTRFMQKIQAIPHYVYEEGYSHSQFLLFESQLFVKLTHHDAFTWPAHSTSVDEKTKDSLVPHSSGSIKSLHTLYLNSKQATDSACHQEFEGFHLPGISIAINTIPRKKNNCTFQ